MLNFHAYNYSESPWHLSIWKNHIGTGTIIVPGGYHIGTKIVPRGLHTGTKHVPVWILITILAQFWFQYVIHV